MMAGVHVAMQKEDSLPRFVVLIEQKSIGTHAFVTILVTSWLFDT